MMVADSSSTSRIRYQPDENPPILLAFGLGLQLVIIIIGGVVITPAFVVRAAGGGEEFLSWVVFAGIIVSGVTTIVQAVRVGRFGSGYILLMGTSAAFISVCVTAIATGGPAMLGTLVIISSLFQFVLASRLSIFRRILTPTVAGTIIMLIPVTVAPIIFKLLNEVPEGTPTHAAPLCALVTILVISAISLKATGAFRLWAPVIGIVIGSVVASYFGLYDVAAIADASWTGLPQGSWPGLDLSFGPIFWSLLPAFILVTLVAAIETIGDATAIQHASWRRQRAVDFRAVQGAVAADGLGNLLSGLFATVPNTTYSTSISATELTGVAARSVGIAVGIIYLIVAFFPKILAIVLAVPNPVVAAYSTVFFAVLFVFGMKMVVRDGLDYRSGLIAGVAFWVGVGFQHNLIFPEFVSAFTGELLQNGVTVGGLVAIILTQFVEITRPSKSQIELEFNVSALPKIREFLSEFASRYGWDLTMLNRLESASEETILTVLQREEDGVQHDRQLRIIALKESDGAVLEFIVAPGGENLGDRIALLSEHTTVALVEHEVSLQLLRYYASSVQHHQYFDTDIVTIKVKASRPITDK